MPSPHHFVINVYIYKVQTVYIFTQGLRLSDDYMGLRLNDANNKIMGIEHQKNDYLL